MKKILAPLLFVVLQAFPGSLYAAGHYCDDAPDDEHEICMSDRVRSDGDCTRVFDDELRLVCWDRARAVADCKRKYRRAAGVSEEQCLQNVEREYTKKEEEAAPPATMWIEEVRTSTFTDDTNVYMSLTSWDPISCNAGAKAVLYLRCVENKTSAYLVHGCYTPTRRGNWPLELRIDRGASWKTELAGSSDNEALGWSNYREARPFIEKLFDSKRLYVRFRDYSGSSAEMEFRIHNTRHAVANLRETCGW